MTYSKDGHKKKKRHWLDGVLKINLITRDAVLSSEEGQFISSGKVPADVEIIEDSEEFVLEAPSVLCVITSITHGQDALNEASKNENAAPSTAILRKGFSLPAAPPRNPSSAAPGPRINSAKPGSTWMPPQPRPGPPAVPSAVPSSAFRRPEMRQERSAGDIMRLLAGRGNPPQAEPAVRAPHSSSNRAPAQHPSIQHAANSTALQSFTHTTKPEVPLQTTAAAAAPPPAKRARMDFNPLPTPIMEQQTRQTRPDAQGNNSAAFPEPSISMAAAPARPSHQNSMPHDWANGATGGGGCRPGVSASGMPSAAPMNTILNTLPTTVSNKWDQIPRASASTTLPLDYSRPPQPYSSGAISAAHLLNRQPSTGQQQQHHAPSTAPTPPTAPIVHHPLPPPGSIYFPGPHECSRPMRRVAIPDRFPHVGAYKQSWENSLEEEITLKIAEVAKDFHTAAATVPAVGAQQAVQAIEAAMRKSRVPYHSACELFIWKNLPGKKSGGFAGGRRRQKKGDYADLAAEAEDNNNGPVKPENVYLVLKSGRGKNVDYSKGDVWIISNDPFFKSGFDPGRPGDRSRVPWVAVVRSLWFGPNQDGK